MEFLLSRLPPSVAGHRYTTFIYTTSHLKCLQVTIYTYAVYNAQSGNRSNTWARPAFGTSRPCCRSSCTSVQTSSQIMMNKHLHRVLLDISFTNDWTSGDFKSFSLMWTSRNWQHFASSRGHNPFGVECHVRQWLQSAGGSRVSYRHQIGSGQMDAETLQILTLCERSRCQRSGSNTLETPSTLQNSASSLPRQELPWHGPKEFVQKTFLWPCGC